MGVEELDVVIVDVVEPVTLDEPGFFLDVVVLVLEVFEVADVQPFVSYGTKDVRQVVDVTNWGTHSE